MKNSQPKGTSEKQVCILVVRGDMLLIFMGIIHHWAIKWQTYVRCAFNNEIIRTRWNKMDSAPLCALCSSFAQGLPVKRDICRRQPHSPPALSSFSSEHSHIIHKQSVLSPPSSVCVYLSSFCFTFCPVNHCAWRMLILFVNCRRLAIRVAHFFTKYTQLEYPSSAQFAYFERCQECWATNSQLRCRSRN